MMQPDDPEPIEGSLYEQALCRIKQLEQELAEARRCNENSFPPWEAAYLAAIKDRDRLAAKLALAQEALEHYASINWAHHVKGYNSFGDVAKRALSRIREMP